jgi:hypothetical protein
MLSALGGLAFGLGEVAREFVLYALATTAFGVLVSIPIIAFGALRAGLIALRGNKA